MEEEVIIRQIIDSANKEATEIINQAALEVKDIEFKNSSAEQEKANQKFEVQKNKIIKHTSSDIEKAEFDARNAELIERKKYIEIVKEKVRQKLLDLDSETYIKVITSKVQEYKDEEDVKVLLPEKCYDELKKIISTYGITVLDVTDSFRVGVIIKCGQIEYNYDFEENMDYLNESIENEINSILFG